MTAHRVALVTGAARGIGLACARKFLAEGYAVGLLDIDAPALRASVATAPGERAIGLEADVADPAQVGVATAACVARFGRLDALVNNAGVAVFKPATQTTFEEWSRVIAVNLTGPFLMTQACAPHLEATRGAIVNITSISGQRASTLRAAYGTSKAGLQHLTKQLAVELGERGVRVNAVAPGPVETAMARQVHTPAIRADYRDAIPLARYGLEEEIAEAVFFLAGDKSSYVTGHTLACDGGFAAAGIGLPTLRGEGRGQAPAQSVDFL